MLGLSSSERMVLWVDRLGRLAESDLTVAEFCRREGVSVPSLYQWKRKLARRKDFSNGARRTRRKDPDSQAGFGAAGRGQGFAELVVVNPSGSDAAVVLPGNIRIELGGEPQVASAIVRQVLEHACPSGTGSK